MQPDKQTNPSFFEELELLIGSQTRVRVVFRASNGGLVEIHGAIRRMGEGPDEIASITMDSGLEIRLDSLVSVNGKKIDNYC
jgi:hypothetical protein